MKIKYLLTLSFCAIATNYCGDSQQKHLCAQAGTSAVAAGFSGSAQSGSARQATEYDGRVDWRETFKRRSTPLIHLFNQLKEAVKANDSINVSKIFKSMNAQFKEMEINDPRYLSFLRDYNNSIGNKYPECVYSEIDEDISYSDLFHLNDKFIKYKAQREEKFNLGREILADIYNQAFYERTGRLDWSLYKTRNESIPEEIADALEYLYCIISIIRAKNCLVFADETAFPLAPRITTFMGDILDIEKDLHQEMSIDVLNKHIKTLDDSIPNIKNSLIKKRAKKVLIQLRQKLSELTKME